MRGHISIPRVFRRTLRAAVIICAAASLLAFAGSGEAMALGPRDFLGPEPGAINVYKDTDGARVEHWGMASPADTAPGGSLVVDEHAFIPAAQSPTGRPLKSITRVVYHIRDAAVFRLENNSRTKILDFTGGAWEAPLAPRGPASRIPLTCRTRDPWKQSLLGAERVMLATRCAGEVGGEKVELYWRFAAHVGLAAFGVSGGGRQSDYSLVESLAP